MMFASTLAMIHRLALAKDVRIATAESLTAGLIAATLANTSGCSEYLLGGIVAYNIDQKVNLLGVDRALADSCDCVSAEVALQMAQGVKARMSATAVIAVTGYAEPWGVKRPHAYYCTLHKSHMDQGYIDLDHLDRTDARGTVVERGLVSLARLLSLEG